MGANAQTSVPLYAAAEVLTAANMNISAGTGVPVFATTVTRDAAFGGAGEKVLAEGQLAYIEASDVVQYYTGAAWATVGPASSGALVLITAVSFTSQTTVSMAAGIFTSTYKNYLVTLNVPTGSNGAISARVNNAGTPRTTNYYGGSGRYGSNNTNTMVASSAATSLNLIDAATAEAFALTINVYDPLNASGKTAVAGYGLGVNAAGFPASSVTGGVYYTAEANDGLTFIFAASSTGFYRVYGLADA